MMSVMSALPTPKPGEPPTQSTLEVVLSKAAAELQKASPEPRTIYSIFRQCAARLGLRGGISLLDPSGQYLIFQVVVTTTSLLSTLPNFESATGYRSEGYTLPVQQVAIYQEVLHSRQARFVTDTGPVVVQAMPAIARPLVLPLLRLLGSPPGIFAPLLRQDVSVGLLNLVGKRLTLSDVQAVSDFTDLITKTLDLGGNILYNKTEQ